MTQFGNVKRFGKSYGARNEQWERHVETPVGKTCMYWRCDEPIEADDDGVIMPLVRMNGDVEDRIMHRDCHLFSLGVISHECAFQRHESQQCDYEWKHDKHRDPFARSV